MSNAVGIFGPVPRFLGDGSSNGLMTAAIRGWTRSVRVANNATLARLARYAETSAAPPFQIEMQHKSGVKAHALAQEDEIVVLAVSEAQQFARFVGTRDSDLKRGLVTDGVLVASWDRYHFHPFAFRSRSSSGRLEWKVVGSAATTDEGQGQKAQAEAEPQ